jgi:hypothetical protein
MALTSAVCFLFVEQPTTFVESFIGYTLGGISFFAIGMCKGLE